MRNVNENFKVVDSDEKTKSDGLFSAFDEIDLEENEEDSKSMGSEHEEDEELEDEDDDEDQKLVIENEYVAEKLSALYCLQVTTIPRQITKPISTNN